MNAKNGKSLKETLNNVLSFSRINAPSNNTDIRDLTKVISAEEKPILLSGKVKRLIIPQNIAHVTI